MNWLTITDPKILKSSKLSFAKTRKFVKDDQVFQKVQVEIYWIWFGNLTEGYSAIQTSPTWEVSRLRPLLEPPSVRSNRDVAMYGRQGKRCLKWCSPNDGNDGNVGQYGKRMKAVWSFWVSRALLCRQGCWRPTSQEDATRYYVYLCALQATGEEDGTLVHRFWGESGVRKRKMNGWRCNVI